MTKANPGVSRGASAGVIVQQIALDDLFLSTEETRRTVDQAALGELAKSIERDGVIEALLVRPDNDGRFEVVAGQRRWLASRMARRTACPCVVREMTDEEARSLRIVSNLQREDLPPIEEAEAYGKLLEEPGATIETVAAKLAKAPGYVGRRLQLLKAVDAVREALKAGAIEVGHALELARLNAEQQARMLDRMRCGFARAGADDPDDEFEDEVEFEGEETEPGTAGNSEWRKTGWSVAELKRNIAQSSHVDLRDAPFPLFDEIPPMACTECPKRAGNAQLLFDDCAQDTCTDRGCFNSKIKLWIELELKRAKAEKRKLLKLTPDWVSAKDVVQVAFGVTVAFKWEGECPHGEEGIWIDGPNAGRRATICRAKDCKTHRVGGSGNGSSSRSSAPDPARKALLAKVREAKLYRAELFKAIAAVKVPALAPAMLAELAAYAIDRSDGSLRQKAAELLGWDKKLLAYDATAKKLRNHLLALPAADAVRCALLFSESSELTVHEFSANARPSGLEALAKLLGVDAAAVGKKLNAAPAPKAAGQKKPSEPRREAKGAKHPALSAQAKKYIAGAQKKRRTRLKKAAEKTVKKAARN